MWDGSLHWKQRICRLVEEWVCLRGEFEVEGGEVESCFTLCMMVAGGFGYTLDGFDNCRLKRVCGKCLRKRSKLSRSNECCLLRASASSRRLLACLRSFLIVDEVFR